MRAGVGPVVLRGLLLFRGGESGNRVVTERFV